MFFREEDDFEIILSLKPKRVRVWVGGLMRA